MMIATAAMMLATRGLVPGDRPLAEKVDAVVRAAGAAAGEIAEKHLEGDAEKREEPPSRS